MNLIRKTSLARLLALIALKKKKRLLALINPKTLKRRKYKNEKTIIVQY